MKKFLLIGLLSLSFLFIGGNTLYAVDAPTTIDIFGRGVEDFDLSKQTDLFDYTIYKKPDGTGEKEALTGEYSFRFMVENVINYI